MDDLDILLLPITAVDRIAEYALRNSVEMTNFRLDHKLKYAVVMLELSIHFLPPRRIKGEIKTTYFQDAFIEMVYDFRIYRDGISSVKSMANMWDNFTHRVLSNRLRCNQSLEDTRPCCSDHFPDSL